ncbi:MAG: hypothetical protein JWM95_1712 [Gemmatimonadetes bacterium]|nr:hypothetical protein [Gemmatimonadota bacterium]
MVGARKQGKTLHTPNIMTERDITDDAEAAALYLRTLQANGVGEVVALQLTNSYISSTVAVKALRANTDAVTLRPKHQRPHS